jgi:hypothetical protein
MPNRFFDLTEGIAMVVTDLHGDRDAFNRCLSHFSKLYRQGAVDHLIILGDLIHGYNSAGADNSVHMVTDVMALQNTFGPEQVIMLLGNHEMPHIYGVSLSKGALEFTPRFEHALGDQRFRVLTFFDSLPFYVRTAAGVLLGHAGPSPDIIKYVDVLHDFDHQAILQEADMVLSQSADLTELYNQYAAMHGTPYRQIAHEYLAIEGPEDPRYSHLLRAFLIGNQSKQFQVLWDALFTQNEQSLSELVYLRTCEEFLAAFSVDAPAEQRVMVSGHITTPRGGSMLVNTRHLRVSSAAHARPREAGQYLLFDCARPVQYAPDLLGGLRNVFE